MNMLKKIVILLLLLIPIANAEIQISKNIYTTYNYGDKLSYDVSITENENLQGFLSSTLICERYSTDYYTIPLSLKQGRQDFSIPDLTLTETMSGNCRINVNVQDLERDMIEQKSLPEFSVKNDLTIDAFLNRQTFKPGETVILSGDVKNSRGDLLDSIPVLVTIDNSEGKTANINEKKFTLSFDLDKGIKSFEHKITLEVRDNGNIGEKTINFYITPIPIKLQNSYEKTEFLPGEKVEIETLLYDQADDKIDNNAIIKVYNPKNKLLTEGARKIIFNLEPDAMPGTYKVKTKDEKLNIESSFKVKELEKIDSEIQGKVLVLKNTGNVPYKDNIRVLLNGDTGFSKSVNIKPNEAKTINLAREILKSGDYFIKLITKQDTRSLGESTLTYEKSFGEKITGPITGSVVSVRDSYGYAPFYLVLIATIMAVILIAYQKNKKTTFLKNETDRKEGERYKQIVMARRENPQAHKRKFDIDDKEVSDFRRRILKDIKSTENNPVKSNQYSSREDYGYRAVKPNENKKNLFGMFD